jgi:ribonuclease P protein component
MKKEFRVKSQVDFQRVIEQGKKINSRDFIVYVLERDHDTYRFGVSVGKKLGNAVFRNKKKRQLREIIYSFNGEFRTGFDCVVILKKNGVKLSFEDETKSLKKVLSDNNILKRSK